MNRKEVIKLYRTLTVVVALLLPLTMMGQKQKREDMCMVYGHVHDMDTHDPLYKTWVYLYDCHKNLLDSAEVNRTMMDGKKGGFMVQAIFPKGQYYLRIVKPGYYEPTAPFELSNNEPLKTLLLKKISATDDADTPKYAWEPTTLEVLKQSPAYAPDKARKEKFEYSQPSDSLLARARNEFNLDSVAGKGDDVSRIKNLLYWVHDNIEHNGSNGFPKGSFSLSNMYHSGKRDSCGYNCRALAISLTEALLAEGIPARYLTCQSKEWKTDGDCHVICVAWSKSLGKWIWVDPSFAAYVTDENGLLLHPGEVRYRLQHDLPLVLNEDANWNHRNLQTKEDYLENYMAKNLYIMSANMLNQAEPEGPANNRRRGAYAALVPQGSDFTSAGIITTDEDWFWQAPQK